MENYQFIRQIGQGDYGEVWLVKCSKTRKKHVLKRIDLHQASKREQRAAHLEAKLLSTIKHPNIVTYLDSFYNSLGNLFIVMNYCEYGDLYTFINNQNGEYFEEKQIVHWFVQICLALKYLHDKNILHRNLKTRNIFLTRNKIIKVGDLGISKVLCIAHEMTTTLIKTPCYTSPEIFAGQLHNEKSDIWALGCCTYEIAALKHPYFTQDIHLAVQNIMEKKLTPIPEIYSFELYEIICSMLDLKPENRPYVTQLLLNDYVRRYILLILQDNSKSPDSQNSDNSYELPMERSKSNSDLTLAVSKDLSNDIQRSMSTCFLSRNMNKNSQMSTSVVKDKANVAKSLFITVPDVNGNGDGNDNSQHRRIIHANKKVDHKTSKVSFEKNTDLLEENFDVKKSAKLKLNTVTNGNHFTPASMNKLEMNSSSSNQKMKGEISFQILNNLAYSLYSARPDNFKNYVSYANNGYSNSEFSFVNAHHSVSPMDGIVDRQTLKKTVKTANTEKGTEKDRSQSNACVLPQINQDSKSNRVTKQADICKSLPHVKPQLQNFKPNKSNIKIPRNKTNNSLL